MTIDRRNIGRIIEDLVNAGTDTQNVEVKESVQKLPASLVETVSAFSNATGGTLILGLSEANGFIPAPGFRGKAMADSFATMCADKMTPPVRPEIELVTYKDAQLVVAYIPECVPRDKPCYVAERGVYNGSYTRVSDGDRKLSSYEVDRLLENRFQPSFDAEAVEQATMEDLDPSLVQAVLNRQRQLHPRIFSAMSDEEALASLHVIVEDEGGRAIPTLSGLLALGVYPQSFFPRLTVAFAAYDGLQPSTKCLDSQSMAGPLPVVIEDTVAVVKRHLYPGDAADADVEERDGEACAFPLPAVREAVANALMHRDYSPAARGTAVQVSVYSDRIEVSSPGGTYGTVTGTDLGELGYSSTRNQFLSSLLESVPYQEGYLVESRGMGYHLIQQELEAAGLPQPEVHDSIAMFTLVMRTKQATTNVLDRPTGNEILDALAIRQDASAAELAEMTGMPRSTVSYRLRKLAAKGLVERIGEVRSPKQRYRLA